LYMQVSITIYHGDALTQSFSFIFSNILPRTAVCLNHAIGFEYSLYVEAIQSVYRRSMVLLKGVSLGLK
jgi:hypothetical protein